MTRDYVVSFVAEGLAVVLALATYRVAAAQWDPDLFGEYALSRKVVSAVLVLALVGADVALVRFIAFDAAQSPQLIGRYVGGALAIVLAATAVVALALFGLAGPLSTLIFGRSGHEDVVVALAAVAFGGSLYGVAYGYERGRLRLGRAGMLLIACTGLAPLIAVVASPASVAGTFVVMGAMLALASGLTLLLERPAGLGRPLVRPVLEYGASRAVGLLIHVAFLAAPAIVAAHRFGIAEAGNVAFALLVLGLLSTLLTPIGVVLLPRSAEMLRMRDVGALERHVLALLRIVVPFVVAVVLVVQVAAEPIVGVFLGIDHAGAATALRTIVWAAIPWTVFMALRSFLDAHNVRALNTRNLAIASLVYGLAIALLTSLSAAAVAYQLAFVGAVVVLGALTVIDARRAFAKPGLAEPVVEDLLQP